MISFPLRTPALNFQTVANRLILGRADAPTSLDDSHAGKSSLLVTSSSRSLCPHAGNCRQGGSISRPIDCRPLDKSVRFNAPTVQENWPSTCTR